MTISGLCSFLSFRVRLCYVALPIGYVRIDGRSAQQIWTSKVDADTQYQHSIERAYIERRSVRYVLFLFRSRGSFLPFNEALRIRDGVRRINRVVEIPSRKL